MPSSETTSRAKDTLVSTLEKIASLDAEINSHEDAIKDLKSRREALAALAVEEMTQARMERGVPAGDRSWRIEWEHSINTTRDSHKSIVAAIRDLDPDAAEGLLSVNSTSLKTWLKERATEAGADVKKSWTEGTSLEGLVSEYVRPVLRHVAVRRREAAPETPF